MHGVYDRQWPRWYAAYAVEHGIGALLGRSIDTDDLAQLLASSFADYQHTEPEPSEPWADYTARRIAEKL